MIDVVGQYEFVIFLVTGEYLRMQLSSLSWLAIQLHWAIVTFVFYSVT